MDNPFTIDIYDRTYRRVGWVNDPTVVTAVPRHNAIGSLAITLPSNHRRLPLLADDGARLLVTYKGEHLISGPCTLRGGSGPVTAGQVTFTVQDDVWLFWRMLGWAAPYADILTQGVKKDTRTGPAETVVKGFVAANAGHLIDPIVVAPDLGRGSTINISSRMALLADILVGPVDAAGVGLTVRQVGPTLVVDVYTPSVFGHDLSEDSATVLSWDWSKADDTATSAIVGGPNEGTSREFRQVRNAAREAQLGYTIETFVDARSSELTAETLAAGQAALDAAGPKSGFKVELSEAGIFAYGPGGVHVGDRVTVNIGGQVVSDVLREATLTYSRDAGLLVTPTIGDRTDDPDRLLARFTASLARGIRDLRSSR